MPTAPPDPVSTLFEPCADSSLLLIGHGSARHPAAFATLARHAAALAQRLPFLDVGSAVLTGGPKPREVLAGLAGRRVLVLPFFMSGGYFATRAVPDRLAGDDRVRMAQALGESPRVTPFLDGLGQALAVAAGWRPAATDLLLVGHGSASDPRSRQVTERHAAGIGRAFASVRPLFLEEPPYLMEVVRSLDRPAVCLGFFAAAGAHAAEDVPRALNAAPVATRYSGAVGAGEGVIDLLVGHLADTL